MPTHQHDELPNRSEVLKGTQHEVRLMSTTLIRYFTAVKGLIGEKLNDGVTFKLIIYNPDSDAIKEKANEEDVKEELFKSEIILLRPTLFEQHILT